MENQGTKDANELVRHVGARSRVLAVWVMAALVGKPRREVHSRLPLGRTQRKVVHRGALGAWRIGAPRTQARWCGTLVRDHGSCHLGSCGVGRETSARGTLAAALR